MEFLLAAMIMIESGGNPLVVGQHGELGPLQIKRVYWEEACRQLQAEGVPARELPGYDACVRDPETSKAIVQAYWRRYCREALRDRDWQTLARVHNGGPVGDHKSSTVDYWRRVQKAMWRLEAAWQREYPSESSRPPAPGQDLPAGWDALPLLSIEPANSEPRSAKPASKPRHVARPHSLAGRGVGQGGPLLLLAALVLPLVFSTFRPRFAGRA